MDGWLEWGPQILEAIPGVTQVDGYTVEFRSETMSDAYRLIRFMYRFVSIQVET